MLIPRQISSKIAASPGQMPVCGCRLNNSSTMCHQCTPTQRTLKLTVTPHAAEMRQQPVPGWKLRWVPPGNGTTGQPAFQDCGVNSNDPFWSQHGPVSDPFTGGVSFNSFYKNIGLLQYYRVSWRCYNEVSFYIKQPRSANARCFPTSPAHEQPSAAIQCQTTLSHRP